MPLVRGKGVFEGQLKALLPLHNPIVTDGDLQPLPTPSLLLKNRLMPLFKKLDLVAHVHHHKGEQLLRRMPLN